MTSFRRFLTLASAAVLATAVFLGARPAAATNYAVCVGVNQYESSYASSAGLSTLKGCVPDAKHMTNVITKRGEWDKANVTLLTDSGATLTAIRQAVSNVASSVRSGDTFFYYHSSHGGNDNTIWKTVNGEYYLYYGLDSTGEKHCICSYNADYTAKMLATDLASFPSDVRIVVMMDTCHSAGMFKYDMTKSGKTIQLTKKGETGNTSNGEDVSVIPPADDSAAGFFMEAVMAQLEQLEADQVRRGVRSRSAKSVASNTGWIAAADYDQYSLDNGTAGGAFTCAFIDGVTNQNKMCDNATYGNQDGYASFYEGWNYAKDIARGARDEDEWYYVPEDEDGYGGYWAYNWADPQCANSNLLDSVLIGWAGKTAPANVAPSFASSTATATVVQNETLTYTFTATGYPAPTYTISTSASGYTFNGSTLSFTPTATGTYTFTCTAANGISPNATCTLTVTVTPPPPETPSEVSVVSSDSFTATWSAVSGASTYELVVLEGAASGGGSGPFSLVTSSSGLTAGEYVILADGIDRAMNNSCTGDSSGVLSYEDVTVDNSTVTTTDASIIWTLAGSADSCTLYNAAAGKYVNPATARNVGWSSEASGTWTLSMNGDLVTVANAANTSWMLQYNSGSPRFALYDNNNQKKLHFYRRNASRALPRAVGDVVYSNTVGNVTSFEVTGLQPDTTYSYSVRAIVNGEPTGWSDSVTVTTTEGDAAPVWSDIPAQSITVGETCTLKISDYVTGSPTPTITMTGSGATFDGSDFSFTPSATGEFTFTFTADNGVGDPQDASLTVTVSAAPVTVPTLTISDVDANSAVASWTACTGVSAYTLQLASDNQFTTGGSGGEVTLFSNAANDPTSAPDGWTYSIKNTSGSYLQLMSGNYVVTEAFDASACTALSLSLYMRTYGGTGQPSVSVEYSTDGGTTWSTSLGTLSAANTTMAQRTLDVSDAAGASSVRLRIASTSTSSTVGVGIQNIVLTGTESSGSGSLIATYTVNDTEYTFTGLTPDTTYYARVQGNDAWSEVKSFTTEAGADSAPEWSAIPAQAVTVGETCTLDLSGYVNGSPAPSITMAETVAGASLTGTVFSFTPASIDSFEFTFTANNGIGSPASATLTVNSTGTAPAVIVPQTTYSTSLGGANVEFTVTATGTPTPTLELSDTTATGGVDFDENDGYFFFTPYATGDFTFTFTATSLAGSDSKIVTVTVSEAAVTVPTLTVSDVDSTSATASWTACDDVTSYTLQLSTNEFSAGAATITDTLTAAKLSLGGSYGAGSYASDDSGAEYAAYGMTKSGGTAIQIRSNDSQSGIVVTKSAGTVSEVRVTFESGTSSNRTLNIYGSSSAYSSAADLYSASTPLGTIVYDGSTAEGSYTINGSYAFIGIRSASGAIYLDNVEIDWTPANGGTTSKGLAKDGGDGIQTFTVTTNEYRFTGLTPETKYYARVKGEEDWSNVEEFTTLAGADSAPVWSALPTGETAYVEDVYELANIASYVSGSPAPEITVTGPAGVLAEIKDGNFSFIPDALGDFVFTFTADNGVGEPVSTTLTVTGIADAPAFVDLQPTVSGYAGGEVTFTVVATGNPAPVLAVDAVDGILYSFDDTTGVFEFISDNTGDYEFEFTAANIAATVTQTVTVTISAAPVTVPVLTVTNVTDTTALATWTACDGVTEYTLQLSTNDFAATSGASARSATPILAEDFTGVTGASSTAISDFDSVMGTNGWSGTFVYPFNEAVRLGKGSGAGSLQTPAIEVGETVRVAWSACWWTNDSTKIYVGVSTDNGTTFDETEVQLSGDMTAYTTNFTVTGSPAIVRWRSSAASNQRFFLDDIAITTFGDEPAGDDIQEFPVADTSYQFTGLTPYTVYYARVKGNAEWSNVEQFITEEEPVSGTAPSWSALPDDASVVADGTYELDLSTYVSGDAPITFTLAETELEADVVGSNFIFYPAATGTPSFTFTASNAFGTAEATLTVTVTGEAPAVTVTSATYSYEVNVGDPDIEFTVTASGHPVPTLTDSCTEGAFYVFENNTFLFEPDTAGTYHFVFTASNSEGEDSKTVTVTVNSVEPPLSDFEQWLADHNASGHTAAEDAPNGHTYWDNYIADVAPDGDFLELAISETAGYLDVENASQNRYYQFIYYTNLLAEPTIQYLGPGFDEMRVEYPVSGTFFARIRALLAAPSQP